MKPGNATVTTMAEAILRFETSKRADRNRVYECVPSIPHRELRRMARRMAKLALAERKKRVQAVKDFVELLKRVHRLEREIDRLDPDGTR